jgi:hypothetical protein
MHTIAERSEIGVLAFALVDAAPQDELCVKLDQSFQSRLKVSKLVISDLGVTAESGVVFEAADGVKIVVMAAVFPHTLAVDGILTLFDPEYPLERYKEVDFR